MATTLCRRMMKKTTAASSLIRRANKPTPPYRNHSTAILSTSVKTGTTNTNLFKKTSNVTHNHFCSLADKRSDYDDILSVIESEIGDAEQKLALEVVEAPREFPFKIEDNPKDEFIRLTREYQGEEIKVKVHRPENFWDDYDEEEKLKEEKTDRQYVFLNVSVAKKSGLIFEFDVSSKEVDGFTVRGILSVKNASVDYTYCEEPDFSELNENLQKGIQEYLEVRGFEPKTAKFLLDYMVKKEHKKYSRWLNHMKNYIAGFHCNSTSNDLSRQVSQATSIPTNHHFPGVAEKRSDNTVDNLLSVIESEIDCAEKKFRQFAETPKEFPFKIEDNVRKLTREYQGEEIKVTFGKLYDYPYLYYLFGSVTNKSGLTLKFVGSANDQTNKIRIKNFDVENPSDDYSRPDFSDLDENFQKAFLTYLEVRGIQPSITKIFNEWILKNKHKKYTAWLKNFKNFLAS